MRIYSTHCSDCHVCSVLLWLTYISSKCIKGSTHYLGDKQEFDEKALLIIRYPHAVLKSISFQVKSFSIYYPV